MGGLVADTHAVVWYLGKSPRLSATARERMREAIASGNPVHVPTICLVELTYLIEKGRLPALVRERLLDHLRRRRSGFRAHALDLGTAATLARVPREQVPDMPDRIIAATALHLNLPLISRDRRIRASGLEVVW